MAQPPKKLAGKRRRFVGKSHVSLVFEFLLGANFAQIITMLMYTLGTITYPHPVGVFEDDFLSFLEGVNSDIIFFVSTTFGDFFNESTNISANFDLLIPQSPSSLSAGADADAHLILVGRRFCPGHQKQGLVVVIKSIIRMNVQKLKLEGNTMFINHYYIHGNFRGTPSQCHVSTKK